jgi:MFS family permease
LEWYQAAEVGWSATGVTECRVLAPILVLILRLLQGVALGGEWGGAAAMSVENRAVQGFYGSFTQLGNPAGALLASGTFALLTINGTEFLLSGGWRIPFLLSVVLVGVGFWIRYRVEELPVFEAESAEELKRASAPSPTELAANARCSPASYSPQLPTSD